MLFELLWYLSDNDSLEKYFILCMLIVTKFVDHYNSNQPIRNLDFHIYNIVFCVLYT